jgi:hypothetical protein
MVKEAEVCWMKRLAMPILMLDMSSLMALFTYHCDFDNAVMR